MNKICNFKFVYRFKNSETLFFEFADDESDLLRKINKRYSTQNRYTLEDIEIIENSMLIM